MRRVAILFSISITVSALDVLVGLRMTNPREPDPPDWTEVQAVMVFCAGVGPHDGQDHETLGRLEHAAELYRKHPHLTIVGIGSHWKVNEMQPDGMRRILLRLGIPERAILTDDDSYDTETNWREAKGILERSDWKRVALLTHRTHLRRLSYLAEREPTNSDATLIEYPFVAVHRNWWDRYVIYNHERLAWIGLLALPREWFRTYMHWRRKA